MPQPHSREDLFAAIESGIRSTGDTFNGERYRYDARMALRELKEQVSAYEDEINERTSDQALTLQKLREEQEKNAALEEQFEAAQRDLAIADQLAEWVRVTISVEGVFSNNLGAQAQAQGLANLLTRYAASRNSNPAERSDG